MSARALIFHMCIFCYKIFLCVPTFFTLWRWPWSLTYYLKTLTLLKIWTAGARALIFHTSYLCGKTFPWVPTIWPCDLELGVWHTFWFNLANDYSLITGAFVFHKHILLFIQWLACLYANMSPSDKKSPLLLNCIWQRGSAFSSTWHVCHTLNFQRMLMVGGINMV